MTNPLTAAEQAWLEQCFPQVEVENRGSAELWISCATPEGPYLDMERGPAEAPWEVLLDGYFTYEQVCAVAEIMRLRQGAAGKPAANPLVQVQRS